jgi:3-deoxy-manno-octulosonate cytidylyltransferase (CMP-KDO synthetase)
MSEKVLGVIPARYASTRLPGKPLVDIAGKPLVQWVWEAACRCQSLDDVVVATDDERIEQACEKFGARVVMTSPDCVSGSDRIAEAIGGTDCSIVVNIQGDEPLIDPATIDACVAALLSDREAGVASAMVEFSEDEDYTQPHMVKVVTDTAGHAMYFSRAPIPDMRRLDAEERRSAPAPMKHVGLYVYRREVLEKFVTLPPSRYELLEKLEQLRLMEAGVKIRMVPIAATAIGVDTPEDVRVVEELLRAR